MITDRDKQQLRRLLHSPDWNSLEALINEMVDKIHGQSKVGDSEWETLKKTLLDEGEERGLHRLQQAIYDLANQ